MVKHVTARAAALVLVLVLIMSLFGCGGNDTTTAGTTPDGGNDTTTADTEAASTLKRNEKGEFDIPFPLVDDNVTISIWGHTPFTGTSLESQNDAIAFQKYEEMTNVHIEWTHPIEMQQNELFNLMMVSQEYTDVIAGNLGNYIGGLDKYVDDDVIVDLLPYAEYMPNYLAARARDEETLRETVTDKGRLASFFAIMYTKQPAFQGYGIRKDWADELGINLDSLVTFDDWHNMLTTFKNAGYGTLSAGGFYQTADGSNTLLQSGFNTISDFQVHDGKVEYGPATEQWKKYLEMITNWYKEGLLDKDFYARGRTDVEPMVLNNKFAVHSLNYIQFDYLNENTEADNPNWTPVKTPLETADTVRFNLPFSLYKYAGQARLQVSTACSEENLKVFLKWADYMYTYDGMLLSNYGIEGESYDLNDEGEPVFKDFMIHDPEGRSRNIMQCLYTMSAVMPHVGFYDWERELASPDITQITYDAMDIWMENSDPQDQLTSVTVSQEHSADYTSIYNEIKTYVSEWMVKVVTGLESIDSYDTMLAEINRMGLEKITQWRQDAVDTYLSGDITIGTLESLGVK